MALKKFAWPRLANLLIKTALILLFIALVYGHVVHQQNSEEIQALFVESLSSYSYWWLIAAFFLMPLNWAVETYKWTKFTNDFEPIGFFKAYRAIFSGVLFSVFTPNRIGEYGGRILWLKPENQWKGVIATILSSFCQILITLSFGIIGLLYFAFLYLQLSNQVLIAILCLGFGLIGILYFLFFNIDLLIPIAKRVRWPQKIKAALKHLTILTHYSNPELAGALLLAGLRYSLYCLQYLMILHFFQITPPLGVALACISTFFLLQTSIPLPPVLGILTRGEVALQIWGHFHVNDILIITSTYTLWVLNVLIPAFMGLIFIASLNIIKSLGYEK